MNAGRTIFSQLMEFLPTHDFRQCVERYDNQVRDWRIYADFAHILIGQARQFQANDSFGIELDQTLYALDSTMIELCLSLFPWARFRKREGGVRLHTLLDLWGNILTIIVIAHAKVHEVNILDEIPFDAGVFCMLDRAYLSFPRLCKIHQAVAFFVTRARSDFRFERLYSHPVDKATGLRCDQAIGLGSFYPRKDYPERLRLIRFYDTDLDRRVVFLTNNFTLSALMIAHIHKCRWQLELFFRWIKQHLRIKAFYGTSENAVKTQIQIALTVYVLVAIVKKRLKLEQSLYTILQILSVSLLQKMPILQALASIDSKDQEGQPDNQLNLFN